MPSMTNVPAPRHTLRVVFALSVLACAVILVLFYKGRAVQSAEFWTQVMAWAGGLTAAICAASFRGGRMALQAVPLGQLLRSFLRQLAWCYAASAILLTVLGFAALMSVTRVLASSAALAVVAGLWLSLWLAPALAAWRSAQALAKPPGAVA